MAWIRNRLWGGPPQEDLPADVAAARAAARAAATGVYRNPFDDFRSPNASDSSSEEDEDDVRPPRGAPAGPRRDVPAYLQGPGFPPLPALVGGALSLIHI